MENIYSDLHDRAHFSTSQIPVSYDPDADAPRFEQFLTEVFLDDPDREEKSVIICEALGYSLLSTCEFEKFFLLIGNGANGKSVLLRVLEDLCGHETVLLGSDGFRPAEDAGYTYTTAQVSTTHS